MKPFEFAFWKYDQFPFVLGGTVTAKKNGMVQTKEFGVGYWFTPIAIIPLERGLKLKKELEELAALRQETLQIIELGFKKKLDELMANLL